MPPKVQQTVRNYANALAFAPPPGFPSRWPAGTPSNFRGPLHSPAIKHLNMRSLAPRRRRHVTLGDGDGLGGFFDDLKAAASGVGAAAIAPAQAKLDSLETAIKTILVFSGIAAATGLVSLVRR